MAKGQGMIKAAMRMAGVDPDASLPELIQTLNENFGLGIAIDDLQPVPAEAVRALTEVAQATETAMSKPGAKLFKMQARPDGKPPVTAFIVVG